jgi:urease accessory protein
MVKQIQRHLVIGVVALAITLLAPSSTLAHTVGNTSAGFIAGFLHPPSGLDHLLAMVSVGIWGAQLGAPAIWLLPIAFPMIMAVGGALGVIGVPLPEGELLVALSVIVLGLLIATTCRLPISAALAIVGVFAIAHGHAHGVELPLFADALAFTVGFVVATGLLHLAGIGIGLVARWPSGMVAIRVCGFLVALAGCYIVYGYAGAWGIIGHGAERVGGSCPRGMSDAGAGWSAHRVAKHGQFLVGSCPSADVA